MAPAWSCVDHPGTAGPHPVALWQAQLCGSGTNNERMNRRREPDRVPAARAWVLLAVSATALVTAYFLLPVGLFGPHRTGLSWTVFVTALVLIAVLLLRHSQDAVLDRPGSHPVPALTVLMCVTILVFASAYLALSRRPGELVGLETRLDALYFTLVTLATVGYGDIVARGQAARLVVVLQIVFTLVFLTAAATAVSGRLRAVLRQRAAGRPGEADRPE